MCPIRRLNTCARCDRRKKVTYTKSERRGARVEVVPPVEGESNPDGYVFGAVIVRMTNEGSLPMCVELAIGDGDSVTTMGDVEKTVIARFISLTRRSDMP